MNIEALLITTDAPLREALARIDAGRAQIALLVDEERRLVGTVSDGDIRRGLLRGLELDSAVSECANLSPKSVPESLTDKEIFELLKREHLHQMPVIDADGRVVGLKLLDELIVAAERPNTVVLMVGGLGRRLGKLTESVPKPMLPVGGRPLLETIVTNFREQGFRRFRFAVNFKSEVIERHFEDGSRFGCEIDYLREPKQLGTAGALSLLEEEPEHPLIVSNGDLVLNLDFGALLARHQQSGADATMAVREYDYQIPYGVVKVEGERIVGLREKPVHQFLISGGLYVLDPSVLRLVPRDTFFDMPALFQSILADGGSAAPYRIDGYWLDIGRHADYEQAQKEFERAFPLK